MSDTIAFLLILPVLVLGIGVLDAAGTLGAAEYRAAVFTEAAGDYAVGTLADPGSPNSNPQDRSRWDEAVATVEQSGLGATAGVCNQTDPAFRVGLFSQPRLPGGPTSPSVAVLVSCPVELSSLLATDRVVAATIRTVG